MNLGNSIAKGNTAEIYLYENKIIKVFNDFASDTQSLYEARKQEYAYSCGLSVPKILNITNINGKQALVMEYVKGKTLGEMAAEDENKTEFYMNMSVEIQQKIHTIFPDKLELMTEKISRQIENANTLDSKHKLALIKKMNSETFENGLCHGDYHLYNLIMNDNKVTIIDWVDSSAGDIRADIYRSYFLYSEVSMELADLYLNLYCRKSGLSKEEIFQWAPIIAGARLAENVTAESSQRLLGIVNQYLPL